MVEVKIVNNRVVLEGHRIKNIPMLAEYEVVCTEETMPMLDEYNKPIFNDNGEPIVFSKFSKVSRVLLKPDEKKEVIRYANEVGGTEKIPMEKQSRGSKRVREKDTKRQKATQEIKEEE